MEILIPIVIGGLIGLAIRAAMNAGKITPPKNICILALSLN